MAAATGSINTSNNDGAMSDVLLHMRPNLMVCLNRDAGEQDKNEECPGCESVSDSKFFQCSKQECPIDPVESLFCIQWDNYGLQMVHISVAFLYWLLLLAKSWMEAYGLYLLQGWDQSDESRLVFCSHVLKITDSVWYE